MKITWWTPGTNYPVTASPGTSVHVYSYFQNIGDVAANWFVSLVDRDTGATVDKKVRLPPNFPTLPPGYATADSCYGTMPNRAWNLRWNVGHIQDSTEVIDDYRDFTINLTGQPKLLVVSARID